MSGADAIVFSKAGFSYGEQPQEACCVSDVDLRIGQGECVVVTGPSGCGKTTLTRMVNGLIPSVYAGSSQGEVRVQGRVVSDWEMDELSCAVGSVFQNPRSQFFNLDTTSEIAFGCENMGVPRDQIALRMRETVDALGMGTLLERDICALSGGEKQLVALASVYAMQPDIFVLDEPTAALDVSAMYRLREVIARMKTAGKTVLIAEHRLWWLQGVADRIVLMEQGRIVDDMPAREFSALSLRERERRGLRAWDIRHVVPGNADFRDERDAAYDAPLKVESLSVRYGCAPRFVVEECDFEARAGHAIALVGRNGAGKTTLARCLAGLHAESKGRVVVCGHELAARKRAGKVYLAMQESGYQLFSDTVEGELALACASRAEGGTDAHCAASIDEQLADFGLAPYRMRHPLSLSGGQRQRLAIAAGSLQGARVMVLDEPTSGLDLGNMQRVAAQVRRLKEQGTCLVIITHDFEFACATCDELSYLENGRIAEHFPLTASTAQRARELFGFNWDKTPVVIS